MCRDDGDAGAVELLGEGDGGAEWLGRREFVIWIDLLVEAKSSM